jgi:DNA-directed RNA polymerase III subunit RPC1
MVEWGQDFLTSSYLITAKDVFYSREQFGQMVVFMGDALDDVMLPPPTIIAPQELWTGKQLFTLLVRPNKSASG